MAKKNKKDQKPPTVNRAVKAVTKHLQAVNTGLSTLPAGQSLGEIEMPPGIRQGKGCLIEPGICLDPGPMLIATIGDLIEINNGVIGYLNGEFLRVVKANARPVPAPKRAKGAVKRHARRK